MPLVLRQSRVTVNIAGTAKPLSLTALKTPSAIVTADPTNSGDVHIGDENVESATETGTPLAAGETLELKAIDFEGTAEEVQLNQIYVDADSAGDAVIVSYYDRIPDIEETFFVNEKSVVFDGVDEYMNAGNNASLTSVVSEITWSAWIKAPTSGTNDCIASRWSSVATGEKKFIIRAETTGELGIALSGDGSNTDKFYIGSVVVLDNTWNHIAFTYSSDTLKLYFNGVEDTSVTQSIENPMTTLFASSDDLLFGVNKKSADGTLVNYYSGNIDELSAWNVELTATEIAEIYNMGIAGNLGAHSRASRLVSWWRMGDGDTFPNIDDQVGDNPSTMINMEAGDIVSDAP